MGLYLIPSSNNPSGLVMTIKKRGDTLSDAELILSMKNDDDYQRFDFVVSS